MKSVRHKRFSIPAPLYGIVFLCSGDTKTPYHPVVMAAQAPEGTFRTPHLFDPELEPAIEAVRFALFLPPTFSDTMMLRFKNFQFLFDNPNPHQIALLPWPAITADEYRRALPFRPPFHWFCPDELIKDLKNYLCELDLPSHVSGFSDLTKDLVNKIWKRAYDGSSNNHFGPFNEPFYMDITREDIGISLPQAYLRQRISNSLGRRYHLPEPPIRVEQAFEFLSFVNSCSSFGEQENPLPSPEQFEFELSKQRQILHLPISVAAPGPAPHFYQSAQLSRSLNKLQNGLQTRDCVIELLTSHHAVKQCGIALKMPDISSPLYRTLDNLESSCRASNLKPFKIWRLIRQMSKQGEYLFQGETTYAVLARAKPLQIFSDFPIGLLIPPGATAPLHLCIPAVYRPLTPLTRALQYELFRDEYIDLSSGFNVLLAECLDPNDSISEFSWEGLKAIKEMLDNEASPCNADLVRIGSSKDLAETLEKKHYDILLLSAHGHYDSEHSYTSLVIGNKTSFLEEIDVLPPIVFLSSCHTAPRGKGAVSIADLLIRKGARAILGTLVPIRVDRSSVLMQRILLYLEQAIAGNEPIYTIHDALHKAVTLNAVHDIETISWRFMKWMASPHPKSGLPIINEFKHNRASGRLRPNHIYKDTIEILLELASETGNYPWVKATFDSTGFFPESSFYTLIGSTDSIILQRTSFQKKIWPIVAKQ